jgi:DNA-directed RNA polymerase subunit RPC12/RpoP
MKKTVSVAVVCSHCGHAWKTKKQQYAYCRKCGRAVKVER